MSNKPTINSLLSELVSEGGPSIESRVAWYHHMQETQPVRYRPEYNLWEVFRYQDVQHVFSNYATFSVGTIWSEASRGVLVKNDPPEHHQFRRLVSKAFTPRRIEELIPRLIQIVDELLEPAMTRGKMDAVTGLAGPLPMRVIAEMLGLPLEDQARFRQWSYQLLALALGLANPDTSELIHYFSDLLNERKRDPRNDLISGLLAAQENGAYLTHEQIIEMCLELMASGNITTTMALSLALSRLCQRPEIYQALRNDPALIPGAIEEILRYDFSALYVLRIARHDTMLGGQEIKAGQYVALLVGAANFDKAYFPQAEHFDIRRSPNPHLAFGHGVHTCIGNALARLEVRVALERIVAHFSEIRLDPEHAAQFMDQIGSFGSLVLVQSLGILFTPVCSAVL